MIHMGDTMCHAHPYEHLGRPLRKKVTENFYIILFAKKKKKKKQLKSTVSYYFYICLANLEEL